MHHGILGMKWGVRRTPEELGHRVKEKESVFKNKLVRSLGSRSSNTLKEARSKDINKLSNEDLKRYNERLNLERNFSQLTEGKVKSARDWVAKTVVTGIFVGAISQLTKQVVKKWLSDKFNIGD